MKATRLYLSLGIAPFAMCAPVPRLSLGPDGEALDQTDRIVTATMSHVGILPPLSRHRPPVSEKPADPNIDLVFAPHSVHDETATLENAESQVVDYPGPASPYQQASPSRERNDMLIVYLAAAFMAVVVVVEMWKSFSKRQGAIRLEASASQPAISNRATPDDEDHVQNEKRHV
ncbi:hypothetical protein C7999DRAFT_41901 [Corynascus novoguineensis]|uniref:Uncharacterized protein n=1 Tax=Corynascus novoguineensis TaxID=1126955 RepID=A0AAN7HIB6_9PEZI|nr:hypothetical protein C7999DRAFT_41901 [Corynascus novoguineensis]